MTLPGTNETLREALQDVNTPNLLLVLATITGDDLWLSERYAPAPIEAPEGSLFPDDSGGYSAELTSEVREQAMSILAEVRDGQRSVGQAPSLTRFHQMLAFSTGEDVELETAEMLMEETRFKNRDSQWLPTLQSAVRDGQATDFRVLIVGAGMSGLGTAAKLKEAGIAFTILEKNDAVGGTWYENRYPDCGVDTPNHFYSYSFHRNPNWSGYFS